MGNSKNVKILTIKKDYSGFKCEDSGQEIWLSINKYSSYKDEMINLLSSIKKNQVVKVLLNNKNFIDRIIIEDSKINDKEVIKVDSKISPEQRYSETVDVSSIGIDTGFGGVLSDFSITDNISSEIDEETHHIDSVKNKDVIRNFAKRYRDEIISTDLQMKIMDSCINRAVRIVTASDYSDTIPSSFIGIIINQCGTDDVNVIKNQIMEVIKTIAKELFLFQTKEVPEYIENILSSSV